MNRKYTYDNTPIIYLVATPIGNLEDISYRAVRILKEVDYIFSEDTRNSIKLLNHFSIKTPLKSYHEHNEKGTSEYILSLINEGKNIAIISDAGYPVISDPGFVLVEEAQKQNISICVIPGANALLSGLLMSGFDATKFSFYGFLDHKESKKNKQLTNLKNKEETLIFYESPHRIIKTLKAIKEVFGNREVAILREITKKYEETIKGNIEDILNNIETLKGEIVLVVKGHEEIIDFSNITIEAQVKSFIEDGLQKKEAIKKVAKLRNLQKNEVYKKVINL